MVKREFGARTWYSLVRLDDGRVAMGGLQSPGEAEAWAMEAGHTIEGATKKAAVAVAVAVAVPTAEDIASLSPEQTQAVFTGIGAVLAADPGALAPSPVATSRPPHGASVPGRKSLAAGRAREAVSVPSVRVGPASPSKESYACCAATRDAYGRLCIGWCGPDCERRPA